MSIKKATTPKQGLKLILRIFLAILAMFLAEHAAEVCHGEPEYGRDESSPPSETGLGEQSSQPRYTSTSGDEEDASESQQRIREGTVVTDLIGQFKVAGEIATFTVTETGQRLGGLENLNLARITNVIRDDPTADWSVSGLVTEFRGSNYILISKAIRKTASSASALKRKSAATVTNFEQEQGK